MAVSTRIAGNQGAFFSLKAGASAAVVFDDLKAYELTNEPKDDSDLTFSEAASGLGVDWTFSGTAIASDDASSLEQYLRNNVGTDVVMTLGRQGNTTPTPTKPHRKGTFKIAAEPGYAGESSTSGTGFDFEFELVGKSAVTTVTA